MANTYTQLYIQLIFAVKHQQAVIHENNRERIEKYICGITKNLNCKPISIYCNPNHIHLLLSVHPSICLSAAVRDIKSFSSRFINENQLVGGHFKWQRGYGAFSYSQSQIEKVKNYIANQKEHHRKITFKEEYISLLKAFEIEYDEKYVFDWLI